MGAPAKKRTPMAPPPPPSELIKRKRAADGHSYEILDVDIKCGEGIDKENIGPNAETRMYQVFGWTGTGAEFNTAEAYGWPDPHWRRIYTMRIRRVPRFLYLEVVRTRSKSDPGTSSGDICVGRTQIPLPNNGTVIHGRYGLVRLKGSEIINGGHIHVAVQITKSSVAR